MPVGLIILGKFSRVYAALIIHRAMYPFILEYGLVIKGTFSRMKHNLTKMVIVLFPIL